MTFAVGAVTGTVLSFEFGLLWPAFTGRFGEVFGRAFAIEGIFFFLEAIFIAIYIFGWKRLSRLGALLDGRAGRDRRTRRRVLGGRRELVDEPAAGLHARADGTVTDVEPLKVIFNPAVPYEVPHMILAAYLVTGFLVASVYAVGMLRGRRDRHHRLGLLIPLTVAASRRRSSSRSATPPRARSPRTSRSSSPRWSACRRPHARDRVHRRPLHVGRREGRDRDPGLDSWLVGFSTDTKVIGLDTVPPEDRPPANTMLHWAFDAMVGICTVLILLGAVARHRLVAQARHPADALVPARRGGLRAWRRSWRSSAAGS